MVSSISAFSNNISKILLHAIFKLSWLISKGLIFDRQLLNPILIFPVTMLSVLLLIYLSEIKGF